MSLLKGHYLHKVYVQMLVQRVHNWIHQSAVAHLGTQGTQYELSITMYNGLLGVGRNIAGPHAIVNLHHLRFTGNG